MMMTMPSPRHESYQSSNYDDIQRNVLDYSNKIVEELGLYPVKASNHLLGEMQVYQY